MIIIEVSNHHMERPVEILLVEDNPGDVRLTIEAFRERQVNSHLNVTGDGVEALAFLRRQGKYANAPRPDLILLDLNLPRKTGHEVLAEAKTDENLRRIPVIILTTSTSEEDIIRTYNLHANCYITKPMDLEQFVDVVRRIEEFWLSTARLPVQ